MAFLTLFIVLPTEKVCTLREVQSGIRVRDIRSRLEICAGLPSQVYNFTSRSGQVVPDDHILELGLNVWNGFMLRVELKERWKSLFEAVSSEDLDFLLSDRESRDVRPSIELCNTKQEYAQSDDERDCVALYLASWTGSVRICQGLLTAGVNPNIETSHHRTPIFAAAIRDNHLVMDILLKCGALLSIKDCNGDTPLDIARRYFATQCTNRIRRVMKDQFRTGSSSSSVRFRTNVSRTAISLTLPGNTSTNFSDTSRPFTAKERPSNKYFINKRSKSDSSFNKRFVAFKDNEHDQHRAKTVPLNVEDDSSPNDKSIEFPGSFTPNSLESSDNQHPDQIVPKIPRDVVLKVEVSTPNSFREKNNKIQGVKVHNNFIENLGFLSIKSALIKDKLQNKLLHSGNVSDRSLNATEVKEDTTMRCQDVETTVKDARGDAQNLSTNNDNEVDNSIKPDACHDKNESHLETNDVKKGDHEDIERNDNEKRPVTAKKSMFRNRKHKRKLGGSLKTALRQIQLAEGQKRTNSANERAREAFQKWLRKKQEQGQESSSQDDSDDSSITSTDERTSLSFPAWLKQVHDRPKYRQDSAKSLKYKNTRSTEGLVEIQNPDTGQSVKAADSLSYMNAFKEWREQQKSVDNKLALDAKEAKRLLTEKRKQMMATAITFNEWLTNCEERKYLTGIVNQSETRNYSGNERAKLATKTSRNIEIQKWRERVDKFEQLHRVHVKSNVRRQDVILERPIKCVSFQDDAELVHGLNGVRHNSHSSSTSISKAKAKT